MEIVRKYWILALFFFIYFDAGAQNKKDKILSIDKYAYQIDHILPVEDSFVVKLDYIIVTGKSYIAKIQTKSLFNKSKTILLINYFIRNDSLVLVTIREQSPKMKDLFLQSSFYFENDKIFDEQYYNTIRACMEFPIDSERFYETYGYNEFLDDIFLKQYILDLLKKIKLQPTMHWQKTGQDNLTSAVVRYQLWFGARPLRLFF